MAFQADTSGTFTTDGVIPRTLFGAGSRGNVDVTPGDYVIVVRPGPELSASTPFTVVASAPVQAPNALPRTGESGGRPTAAIVAGIVATLLGLLFRRAERTPTATGGNDGRGRVLGARRKHSAV
jgi:LPXTG-motif cell wall-anchored protein